MSTITTVYQKCVAHFRMVEPEKLNLVGSKIPCVDGTYTHMYASFRLIYHAGRIIKTTIRISTTILSSPSYFFLKKKYFLGIIVAFFPILSHYRSVWHVESRVHGPFFHILIVPNQTKNKINQINQAD